MTRKTNEVPTTRARVIRQRTLANGQVVKTVVPIEIRLPQTERRRLALALEWERLLVASMR